MDRLKDKYKEIEKRIKFNENAMKDDTGIINDLKESFETLETDFQSQQQSLQLINADIHQMQVTIDSQTDEISLISSEVEEHATELDIINDSIDSHTEAIESHFTTLNTQESKLTSFESVLNSHENTLVSHSAIIANLSQSPPSSNSTIEDLNNAVKQYIFEPLCSIGGYAKISLGTKSLVGPYATIFTRVLPGTRFTGELRFYISNISSNMLKLPTYLDINDVAILIREGMSYDKKNPLTMTIPFDFVATQASNVFKIRIVYDEKYYPHYLETAVLDYIEIETENAQNFLCLNRDIEYSVNSFYENNNVYNLYSEQNGNNGRFIYESQDFEANANFASPQKIISIPNSTLNITRNHLSRRLLRGSSSALIDQLSIAGEEDALYKVTKKADNTAGTYAHWLLFENVYDASSGYHWKSGVDDIMYCVCGTTFDQQPFIGDDHVTINDIPTLSGIPLPNEFITCTAVKDLYAISWNEYCEIGYLLLHNSGRIFYIEEKDADYFIDIGIGIQPHAFLQADRETIHIYYYFNNRVYRKKLILNAQTGKWELDNNPNNIVFHYAIREVIEFNENNLLLYHLDGTREVKTIP